MIAFSCVHCGQRMNITEEAGNKKATCPQCGQAVLIPGVDSGVRLVRPSKKRNQDSAVKCARIHSDTTKVTKKNPKPPSLSDSETRAELRGVPGIHNVSTRIEKPVDPDDSFTSMLTKAESPDELGRFGSYRVLDMIGAGGMGVVFKAHEPTLDRLVALKVMLPALAASSIARQRFLREARAAAQIQHDHIVTIFQVGEERGIPWLAMPLLRGESLDQRIRNVGGPLEVKEILRVSSEIAEGLCAIHELGLIHRDIKPANIFLEGGAARVKILDFGLARAVGSDAQLTQEGSIVGSPAFMAPEQATREPIDARADLFSLGCVMYLMATGLLPFEGKDAMSTLMELATKDPTPVRKINASIPDHLANLIERLLSKKAERRPGSAREVNTKILEIESRE